MDEFVFLHCYNPTCITFTSRSYAFLTKKEISEKNEILISKFLELSSENKIKFLCSYFYNAEDDSIVSFISLIDDSFLLIEDFLLFKIAIRYNKLKTAVFLLQKGADVTCENNYAICHLCDAYDEADISVLKTFIEYGANVKANDNLPICLAVNEKSTMWIKTLIEEGADVTARNNYPICVALYNKVNLGVVNLIIENGGDITCRNNLPFVLAISNRLDKQVLDYLISVGADPMAQKKNALNVAVLFNVSIIDFLINMGADINEIDPETVAKIIIRGDLQVLKILVDKEYDFKKLNNSSIYKPNDNLVEINNILENSGVDYLTILSILNYEINN